MDTLRILTKQTNATLARSLIAALLCSIASAQDVEPEFAFQIVAAPIGMALAMASDLDGNVYTAGYFIGSYDFTGGWVDFDPGPGEFLLYDGGGFGNIYVQKVDAFGRFIWAVGMGNQDTDGATSIKVDDSGNVYVAGKFRYTVDFDPGPRQYLLSSHASDYDFFILKLDPDGNLVYAKNIAGGSFLGVTDGPDLALGPDGSVFMAGGYLGTVDFDPGPGEFVLRNKAQVNIFVLKLDPSGDFEFVRSMGNFDIQKTRSIAVDGAGNIYMTGQFASSVDFDPGPGVHILTSKDIYGDIFVCKLDSLGNFVFAHAFGTLDFDAGTGIAVDDAQNIYTTGKFSSVGTIDFDPGPGTYNLNSTNSESMFVLKLDATGDFVFAVNARGTTGYSRGRGIFVKPSGEVVAFAHTHGQVDVDPGPGVFMVGKQAQTSLFIQVLTPDGKLKRAFVLEPTNIRSYVTTFLDSFTVGYDDSILMAGHFFGDVDFDPGPGSLRITAGSYFPIFVVKLKDAAPFVWPVGVPLYAGLSIPFLAIAGAFILKRAKRHS